MQRVDSDSLMVVLGIIAVSALHGASRPQAAFTAVAHSSATAEWLSGPPASWMGAADIMSADDPLDALVGDWDVTVFLVGAGQFSGPRCGKQSGPGRPKVTVAPPAGGTLSISMSCDDGSDYTMRLVQDSVPDTYRVTVHSRHGISVDEFPVRHSAGQGWRGSRELVIDGEAQSITATVAPIEGRNWLGWTMAVAPTADINADDLERIEKPYLKVDLTRRK